MAFAKKLKKFNISAELQEELSNRPLNVKGKIPDWLSGSLVRNGPITVAAHGQKNAHWFDGLAMLHAFSFHEGEVKYTNKFLRTDAYKTVFEEGSVNYDGFAADPCRSLFKRFLTFFFPRSDLAIHNANVNVTKFAEEYVALTEVPLPVKFDKQTLDTLGVLNYQDSLPKDKCWESAHPHHDSKQKKTFNYLIKYGKTCYYTLYAIEDGFSERKVIAEVSVQNPAYMHSFSVTENYIILTEYPFLIQPLDLIMGRKSFIKNFTWQPEKGTRFIVINRNSGETVGEYVTNPFFAFHHANAFEKEGLIHLDIVTYKDAIILSGENLYVNSDHYSPDKYPTQLERFSFSLTNGKITSDIILDKPSEFPRINETHDGLEYRFVYLAGFSHESQHKHNPLYKIDTLTKERLEWSEEGCVPGEPVFIQTPGGSEEDQGVILAVVLDKIHHGSFLLILDARSFKELGRAKAPHLIPQGLHGQYFQ